MKVVVAAPDVEKINGSSERAVFNFLNSLLIASLFDSLMASVYIGRIERIV